MWLQAPRCPRRDALGPAAETRAAHALREGPGLGPQGSSRELSPRPLSHCHTELSSVIDHAPARNAVQATRSFSLARPDPEQIPGSPRAAFGPADTGDTQRRLMEASVRGWGQQIRKNRKLMQSVPPTVFIHFSVFPSYLITYFLHLLLPKFCTHYIA